MPTFEVTDPQTGVTLELTGDSPPTEQELEQIFASVSQQGAQDGIPTPSDVSPVSPAGEGQRGIGEQVLGGLATAGEIAGSIVREPIKGLAGIVGGILPGEEGQAIRAMELVEAQAPQIRPGTAAAEQLQAVGETLAPVGEVVEAAETGLGQAAFEATGSPAAAAVATTIPTALMEAIGLGAGGRVAKGTVKTAPSKRAIDKAIKQSAPDAETVKNTARVIYKQLDDSGVEIKEAAFNQLAKKIRQKTKKAGLDPRVTPRAAGALEAIEEGMGRAQPITEVDTLRTIARNVADSKELSEKSLSKIMTSTIDDFLDDLQQTALNKGNISASEIGGRYKAARDLWGRARKSELIQEAIENAKDTKSGFENGIRIEMLKLAKNKRNAKFFTGPELQLMRGINRGNAAQNFTRFLGRFALTEGQAGNVLNALAGSAAGAAVGGTTGALAAPLIGTVSRRIAQKLTKGRAEFVDSIVRAGSNGKDITKAYLNTVPKGKRSVEDLANLLSDPSIDTKNLIASSNKLIKQAAEIAEGRKMIGKAAGALAPTAVKEEEQ